MDIKNDFRDYVVKNKILFNIHLLNFNVKDKLI